MLVPDQSVFVDWQKVKVQEDSAQVRWHIQEQSLGKQLAYSKTDRTVLAASRSSSGPAMCRTATQAQGAAVVTCGAASQAATCTLPVLWARQ